MIRLEDVVTFVWAVESVSLSEMACQLSISPGLASAAVQRLERCSESICLQDRHGIVPGWPR